jgi:AcrR family transcriptional regulator
MANPSSQSTRDASRPAKAAARSSTQAAAKPRRRLNADARRGLILKAARKAFSESGDMSGTTIRTIADKAGISEGLIYRHFESKEQLYIEAVVDPLTEVVDRMIAVADALQGQDPLSEARGVEVVRDLNDELVSTLEEVLPLLGLVLFGDPKLARRFYRNNFAPSMDRMAEAWRESEARFDWAAENADIWVRAVMGMCLIMALESRHNPKFDRARAITLISEAQGRAFFPPSTTGTRRRGKG